MESFNVDLQYYYGKGNREIARYNRVDEAIQLTRHYLDNDSLREEIRLAGVKKSRKNHTDEHQFQEIF